MFLFCSSYDKVLLWMAEKCDPNLILQPSSSIWHSLRYCRWSDNCSFNGDVDDDDWMSITIMF